MDILIEAGPVEAKAVMTVASVKAQKVVVPMALVQYAQVASFACPSIAGHSLSAVAPDHIFEGGTALAAA